MKESFILFSSKNASPYKLLLEEKEGVILFSFGNDEIILENFTLALFINPHPYKKKSSLLPFFFYPKRKEKQFIFNEEFLSNWIGKGKKIIFEGEFLPQTQKLGKERENISHSLKGTVIIEVYETTLLSHSLSSLSPFLILSMEITEFPQEIENLSLFGYAPLYADQEFHSLIGFKKNGSHFDPTKITFYSNGWQSWSNNYTLFYGDKMPSYHPLIERVMNNTENHIKARYKSEYHCVIYDQSSSSSWILSFITLKDQFSRIIMDHIGKKGEINKLYAYSQVDNIKIKNLNEGLKRSEKLMILPVSTDEAYEALAFSSLVAGILARTPQEKEKERTPQRVLSGWCSWYYYYTKITEKEFLKNLSFFEKHKEIPIDLVQLDDGYQTAIGDWGIYDEKFNEKFPHGLKWLVENIHKRGFKAGLWVAPFFITKKSKLYRDHPHWLILNRYNKSPIKSMFNWGAWQFGMDVTREDVQEHIKTLASTIGKKWNFDFLKIDFLYSAVPYEGEFSSKNISRAQMLYKAVSLIKEYLGASRILLGCGAPLGPCVGVVDVMRIGEDTGPQWAILEFLLDNKLKIPVPSLKPALRDTIQRSYMHNTYWINDPDCVIVRENNNKLTFSEILLQLTIFALSGGQVLISDDEEKVSQERLHLLSKILPPQSPSPLWDIDSLSEKEAPSDTSKERELYPAEIFSQDSNAPIAIPSDIFRSSLPRYYLRRVAGPFKVSVREQRESTFQPREESWPHYLSAIINWKRKPLKDSIKIRDLLPYKDRSYFMKEKDKFLFIGYEFWENKIYGLFSIEDTIENIVIDGHGCKYFIFTPLSLSDLPDSSSSPEHTENPFTIYHIGSSFHVISGKAEISQIYSEYKGSHLNIRVRLTLPGFHEGSFSLGIMYPSSFSLENISLANSPEQTGKSPMASVPSSNSFISLKDDKEFLANVTNTTKIQVIKLDGKFENGVELLINCIVKKGDSLSY